MKNTPHFIVAVLVFTVGIAQAAPKYPIVVRGGDEASFTPEPGNQPPVRDGKNYDTIVVGAGLAGLSASVFITDKKKHVLLLEKEPGLGGLAQGGALSDGIRYDRGAAYWTETYKEEQKILERIGLGNYKKKYPIYEPIDSYLWNGTLYAGIWDKETLEILPASFELFKHELEAANAAGQIPDQPIEDAPDLTLDKVNTREWIREMPLHAALRTDPESVRIYNRYKADTSLPPSDPMDGVIGLMDLYCRSALGTTSESVSAVAFANFYISEIVTRYTTNVGTSGATDHMVKILAGRPKLIQIETSAPVVSIVNQPDRVEVTYLKNGQPHVASAKYAVFAAQVKLAPRLIQGMKTDYPEHAAVIEKLDYAHYSVHNIRLKGHPYRATYDTWMRPPGYSEEDPTDFILGRWMDPKIHGYTGMRDFKTNPADDDGIFTIYHPLPAKYLGTGYGKEEAIAIAERAVDHLVDVMDPFLQEKWGTHMDIVSVETSRWPFSVHVARPGHFISSAKILRQPVGRVFFANNNMGTPAFEEALFRGHCAADNVLNHLLHSFEREKWSRCHLEK